MCGEHFNAVRSATSPPPGIIPACAGNTRHRRLGVKNRWDHPRMCGEHYTPRMTFVAMSGSSPHVRGTPPHNRIHRRSRGIIPACAGNTLRYAGQYSQCGDHPRMCGEHLVAVAVESCLVGSSPHVRGTHYPVTIPEDALRIIPACAGNTTSPFTGE